MNNNEKSLNGINVIYGGSFNPPTIAHYEIAKKVIERYNVKNFIFLPTSDKYKHKNNMVKAYHRIHMLEYLVQKLPNSSCSDYEVCQREVTGTFDTLKHFKDYYFLMGADKLINLPKWTGFEENIKNVFFIIIERDNIDINDIIERTLKEYKNHFIIFDEEININNETNLNGISSSIYRIKRNHDDVLPEVEKYIEENNLYNEKN